MFGRHKSTGSASSLVQPAASASHAAGEAFDLTLTELVGTCAEPLSFSRVVSVFANDLSIPGYRSDGGVGAALTDWGSGAKVHISAAQAQQIKRLLAELGLPGGRPQVDCIMDTSTTLGTVRIQGAVGETPFRLEVHSMACGVRGRDATAFRELAAYLSALFSPSGSGGRDAEPAAGAAPAVPATTTTHIASVFGLQAGGGGSASPAGGMSGQSRHSLPGIPAPPAPSVPFYRSTALMPPPLGV